MPGGSRRASDSALTATPGGELAIVPGARCIGAAGVPDVMRGEETQLVGAIRLDEPARPGRAPGTHSKWAVVERGRLVEFATYMTGELYAVLLSHSILGRMAAEIAGAAEARGAAFARGVVRGSAGDGLAHAIFGARTLALAGDLAPEDVGDWLSGVLIGDEIRAARGWAQEHGVDAAKCESDRRRRARRPLRPRAGRGRRGRGGGSPLPRRWVFTGSHNMQDS